LLWLWHRLVATAPIRPLAWEPPYAEGAAREMAKRQKKKERKKKKLGLHLQYMEVPSLGVKSELPAYAEATPDLQLAAMAGYLTH